MSQRRAVALTVFGSTAVSILFTLLVVSMNWGIAYAGSNVILLISDGSFVVSWAAGGEQSWGDWGWWIQSPWTPDLGVTYAPSPVGGIGVGAVHYTPGKHPPWVSIPLGLLLLLTTLPTGIMLVRRGEGWQRRAGLAFEAIGLVYLLVVLVLIDPACIMPVGIVPALLGLAHYRRKRRSPSGHCTNCGYNLFGNTSGICPECGVRVAPEANSNS